MSRDLNKVLIIGRLGKDPELRFTQSGQPICSFTVASGRSWRDGSGGQHDETEWFRVAAWDKLGEICNQYLTKGTRIYVEGRLQTRKWQDQNGQDRYSTEVIASEMIMLDAPNARPAERDPGRPEQEPADDEVYMPPAAPPPSAQAAARVPGLRKSSAGAVVRPPSDDEDLPF